jgi:hypothetical protein
VYFDAFSLFHDGCITSGSIDLAERVTADQLYKDRTVRHRRSLLPNFGLNLWLVDLDLIVAFVKMVLAQQVLFLSYRRYSDGACEDECKARV